MIVLATMHDIAYQALSRITFDNNKVPYCEQHGYTLAAKTDNWSDVIYFDKIQFILDILENNPEVTWVWWLDCDALITNFTKRIEDVIDDNYHIIMATDVHSLNCGSFFVKNSPEAIGWLKMILSWKDLYRQKRWDNPEQYPMIINYIKYRKIIKLLPQREINSFDYRLYPGISNIDMLDTDGQWQPGDWVLHWPSVPNENRIAMATQIQIVKDSNTTSIIHQAEKSLNIGITSMYNDAHADLAEVTWTSKVHYATKHGYKLFPKTSGFTEGAIHIDKLRHMLSILNNNSDLEWLWWLDNDAMITNHDVRLESIVDNKWHVIISTDCHSLNTGSFIVRNSQETKDWFEFLLELAKAPEYANDKRWFEQQMVIDTYVKYRDIIKVIPQKTFNSYQYKIYNLDSTDLLGYNGEWTPGDFVIHWPAIPNSTRLQLAALIAPNIQDS